MKPMNERESKLGAITGVMADLFMDIAEKNGNPAEWINTYPEKFMTAIEEIERQYEYAR